MPVRFDQILGQAWPIETLQRQHAAGRLPHAILLEGPRGVGKLTLARALAGFLLCQRPDPGGACGACPGCVKVDADSHPDLNWLRPNDKNHILVDDVRALERALRFRAYEGGRKLAVIEDAHRLGPGHHAQNALLKTLEEPPDSTHIILVTHRRAALLPTIISRTQALRLNPLTASDVQRVLARAASERSSDELRLLAAMSEGAPGLALELDLELVLERREVVVALDARLEPSDPRAPLVALDEARDLTKDRASFDQLLDTWSSWARDIALLAAGLGPEALTHVDRVDELERLAQARGLEASLARADAILEARRQLDLPYNLNATMLAEQLMLNLAGKLPLRRSPPRA